MTRRGAKGTGKRRRKPPRSAFKPGQNSQTGEVFRRGPDILPRKQIVATLQMAALGQEQWRDPKTSRLSRSKRAKLVRGAGMRDLFRAHARLLYVLANGDAKEAAALASAVTRTGDYFAMYLDDKPTGQPRVTKFIYSGQEPNQEIPPDQGQRKLSPAEDDYEAVDPDEVPEAR